MARIYTLPITSANPTESTPSQRGGDFLFEDIRRGGNKYSEPHHCLLTARIDGVNQALWLTEPSLYDPSLEQTTIVRLPGLGEVIENGVGLRMHTELSGKFPTAKVVTIANSGHGKLNCSSKSDNSTRNSYSIEAMANQRAELLAGISSDRLIIVGTSMGSVIGNKLVQLSLNNNNQLNIAGSCWYAPALVTPNNAKRDILRFLPKFAKDSSLEVAYRSNLLKNPLAAIGALSIIASSIKDYRISPAAATAQLFDIYKGTPLDEIENTVANLPSSAIVGTADSLKELAMWREFADKYPHFLLKEVDGRGHGMTLNPVKAVHKITKTIRESGLMPTAVLAEVASS